MQILPTWVTVSRAAPALDMKEDQVYRLIRENKFPFRFIRFGKQIRINARDIGLATNQVEESAEARAEVTI